MEDDKETKHDECIAELHQEYHRYKLRFRGHARRQQPLDYHEWLEHTAARLAEKLGAADEQNEMLEEERDRYKHAAQANHDMWLDMMNQRNHFYSIYQSLRAYLMAENFNEVKRLLLHWAMWN